MIYENYFKLSRRPFSIAPNPHFLFAQGQYREAMAALEFAMVHRGGFVLLTGEVGTGKTTLCKHLLQHIPQDTELALILHPQLDRLQLLKLICREFDLPVDEGSSELSLIESLTEFLLDVYAKGGYSVLIIDEAQHLDFEVLELIRLLTNLETHEDKLLQIILLGQPELKTRLERHELRQLNQRFTARYHLKPLTDSQVAEYVSYRLKIAGCDKSLFSRAAFRQLAKLSSGIPRLINVIADRSLMGAYAEERTVVSAGIVKQAASEVLPEPKQSVRLIPEGSALKAFSFVVLLLMLGTFIFSGHDKSSILHDLTRVFHVGKPKCVECWQGQLPSALLDNDDWIKYENQWAVYSELSDVSESLFVELPWPFSFGKSTLIQPGESHESVAWVRQALTKIQGQPSMSDGWEVIRPQGGSQMRVDYYDPLLVEQVRQFQLSYALRVDGVIGSQTLMALSRANRQAKISSN